MSGIRTLLAPASWAFGAAVAARNWCYDRGFFRVHDAGVPVISVGNITAGGTGKTPLVSLLVERLLEAGARPAVLSRGYRRITTGTVVVSDGSGEPADADRAGDEPALLARRHPGAVVVVDEDRARGARHAVATFAPDAIILDDGFQHRALRRDLDIVVLGPGRHRLLPAGDGREPVGSLRRAHALVVRDRTDETYADILRELHGRMPVIRMNYRFDRLTRFGPAGNGGKEDDLVDPDDLRRHGVVAFSGIGDPSSFGATLREAGLEPRESLPFPDHHRYAAGDLAAIADAMRRAGARYAVTTEKDAVRLSGPSMPPVPFAGSLAVATVRAELGEGGDALIGSVLALSGRGK